MPLGVQVGEPIRNRNFLRANLCAVTAIRAGNQFLVPENGTNGFYCLLFLRSQWLKFPHETYVVFQLLQGTHARQNHSDTFKSCGKADGIAGIGAAVEAIENLLRRLWEIDQYAALDGLDRKSTRLNSSH